MSVKYKDQTIAGRTIAYLPDADVYSTEETVVGQWIDGKPIYSKTLIFSNIATTVNSRQVIGTVIDIDHLVCASGWIKGASYEYEYVIPSDFFLIHRSTTMTENNIQMYCSVDIGISAGEIYIEYTKTTDTATIAIPTAAEMAAAYAEGVQSA